MRIFFNQSLYQPTITVVTPTINAAPGDTVNYNITLSIPDTVLIQSIEMELSCFDYPIIESSLTISDELNSMGWFVEQNDNNCPVLVWFAGSEGITGNINVLNGSVIIDEEADSTFIELNITEIQFNEIYFNTIFETGGINILVEPDPPFVPPFNPNYGDVSLNGTVSAWDGSMILEYLLGDIVLDEQQQLNAEVSGDSTISAYDTSLILQWGVEIINEFPIELGEETVLAFGELSMEDMQVEAGNSISVPLYLENGYDIFSFEFDLLFDNSSLEFTGIRKGENINNFQVLHSQNENALKIVGANAYEDGETGVFLELLFNVPANYNESSTEVVLSRMRFNENEFIEDSTSAILTYAPPNSPANVQIQIINNNTYLTWDIVNRATKYHVYRSANPENGFFRITPYPAGISETSFIDTESGDKYFYYITAE